MESPDTPVANLNVESESQLTPAEIVEHLDEYIIAQKDAKRAVAIALRNRWRRLQVSEEMREEITPKNIIMIGPTGVGKTEISRRLARLVGAPFVKVEATRFTEVGYVGRDVESIIRDLVEDAHRIVKNEQLELVREAAEHDAEERILDLLLPESAEPAAGYVSSEGSSVFFQTEDGIGVNGVHEESGTAGLSTREKLRTLLQSGNLENREVEIEVEKQVSTQMQVLGPHGLGEMEGQIKDMFANMAPKQVDRRKLSIRDARKILVSEAQEQLVDHERIAELALERARTTGIVFLDEIDKVCGGQGAGKGPDVSREGVQRDLLPLVEGTRVTTKYGFIDTDHILFIASGAFHVSRPSDLMPEFQGRFPIRVELRSLRPEDFMRILVEPKNALVKQYQELLKTEGVMLGFTEDSIRDLAYLTAEVNSNTEDIGARRLHTMLEHLLEDLSFSAHERSGEKIVIDSDEVMRKLSDIAGNRDLSQYIL